MRLEKYLVLNKYLLSLFGASSISDLREELKNKKEGFDNDGKSYFVDVLIGLEKLVINPKDLLLYDSAIKEYSYKLSNHRRENITLKYFQYLAVLFAEIYLDRYFNRKNSLLSELNSFLEKYKRKEGVDVSFFEEFEEKDLKKLAYWMATGSGKTLIMHINYWQFLKYNTSHLDNIIMVTPNEGLSKQHYNEMQRSGVQCRLYSENLDNLTLYPDQVLVLDIHKLTEEKKGAGIRVETSNFEGRNLVFIDEGHKGQTTEEQTWKKLREDLGKNGFVFEYSATFGQVIDEENRDLLNEYSKAIVFDYSYKYFYEDGYGKDFYVYNLRENNFTENYKELILSSNLLSFYEQFILYEKNKEELRQYLIEKPLWAFIGSKVIGKNFNSDVLDVVLFLKKIIEDRAFLKKNLNKIINNESGLKGPDGEDIFNNRYEYLRKSELKVSDICKDICKTLFNANNGTLCVHELKSAEGELGLKIGDGEYFGVVNIGDVSSFKKLLIENDVEVKTDNFTLSLFERVNEPNSNINVLIGAKKFIEGWDSWRVCSMGLINMGKGEGPQIIQLFGRGVRLKGEDLSLKRSQENKYHIKSLETLNIFGLNADYINSFLETIRKEEVEYEEIKLPIKLLNEEKLEQLYTLKLAEDFDFTKNFIKLEYDESISKNIKIDISPKIRLAHGMEIAIGEIEPEKIDLRKYLKKYRDLFNWDRIYLKMLDFKINKGYSNLQICNGVLQEIIEKENYELKAESSQTELKTVTDIGNLEDILLMVLKSYTERYYNCRFRQIETNQLQLSFMEKGKDNLSYDHYTLKIEIPKDEDERERIDEIKTLINEVGRLYQDDLEEIPTIHFDKHLYTPLVVYKEDKEFIKSEPVKLNNGETEFVKKLRDYINQNQVQDKEIFLLRNLSKRGIGFFQNSSFYPDFIMWIKKENKQFIVFIDPKGIRNLGNFNDEKIQLHKYIKDIETNIKETNPNVKLESLILSVSKYDDIKNLFGDGNKEKVEFEENHILFINDDNLVTKIFECIKIEE
ncbi:MAG: DEAD/DEAH box helicase family protein [Candidatus Micrarchaeaceae archaeon]